MSNQLDSLPRLAMGKNTPKVALLDRQGLVSATDQIGCPLSRQWEIAPGHWLLSP